MPPPQPIICAVEYWCFCFQRKKYIDIIASYCPPPHPDALEEKYPKTAPSPPSSFFPLPPHYTESPPAGPPSHPPGAILMTITMTTTARKMTKMWRGEYCCNVDDINGEQWSDDVDNIKGLKDIDEAAITHITPQLRYWYWYWCWCHQRFKILMKWWAS